MSIHELLEEDRKGIVSNWRSGFLTTIIGRIITAPFRGSHLAINGSVAGLIAVILSASYSLKLY